MNTPICDFARDYAQRQALRLHMPGHKGVPTLGVEHLDITELDGADSLYEASGIIRQSEENAGSLFGCPTFYSTEGSSQCIRAMLYLVLQYALQQGRPPRIAAARNVHKTFLSAAALLDLDVTWLYPAQADSYLSCRLTPQELDAFLSSADELPAAVYLTSPDYLGTLADIGAIAQVCHRHSVLLAVDNAHGAYLKFLSPSCHPMDLGADLCCDSAHKTLPVLTGGAYLHISPNAPALLAEQAKNALALFGSTSPSYLILQSLDAANRYLACGYPERLAELVQQVHALKASLTDHGYCLYGDEPIKITLCPKPYGYIGDEFAALLVEENIFCEFHDPDFVVFMVTPETGKEGLDRLKKVLLSIPAREAIECKPPECCRCQRVTSIREAVLAPCETIAAQDSAGRILAAASVGCPPAVPIVVCGERINDAAIQCFSYYGITECTVMTSR